AASRLRHDLAGHGDEATVRAIPGSGLLAVNFDWLGELGRLARRHHPEVAVLEFAGNYVPPLRRGIAPGSDAFFRAWDEATTAAVRVLVQSGATVYLVLIPPMRSPDLDRAAQRLNRLYEAQALREAPNVGCIDGRLGLAGPDGGFAAALPDERGRPVQLRQPDGVHLTPAGARRFADHIALVVNRQGRHPTPACV
ncbi:MAG TPA: GDSL-type esterase/lipase family protein, partial [Acidimicrobiales bacterium]|nr:GDSL-type esterase/lipase family protein [Acidimicrobiales bacterium]